MAASVSARDTPRTASAKHSEVAQERETYAVMPLKKALDNSLIRLRKGSRLSGSFNTFVAGPEAIRFLTVFHDFFEALFHADDVVEQIRSHALPLESFDPCESDVEERMRRVGALYSAILLQESRYQQSQQDNKFFETFYDFVASVLVNAFGEQRRTRIEEECSRIFRTDTFNITRRLNEEARKPYKMLTSQQLYLLRYHGDPTTSA